MGSKKPGYTHLSFWLTTAALVATGVIASDAVAESGMVAKLASLVVSALAAAGYSVSRGRYKEGDPSKPAWKQTEWWISSAAVLVSVLIASEAFSSGSHVGQGLAMAAALLAKYGYGAGQSMSSGPATPKATKPRVDVAADMIDGPLR